jgi:hypothetical protein
MEEEAVCPLTPYTYKLTILTSTPGLVCSVSWFIGDVSLVCRLASLGPSLAVSLRSKVRAVFVVRSCCVVVIDMTIR